MQPAALKPVPVRRRRWCCSGLLFLAGLKASAPGTARGWQWGRAPHPAAPGPGGGAEAVRFYGRLGVFFLALFGFLSSPRFTLCGKEDQRRKMEAVVIAGEPGHGGTAAGFN